MDAHRFLCWSWSLTLVAVLLPPPPNLLCLLLIELQKHLVCVLNLFPLGVWTHINQKVCILICCSLLLILNN